MRQCPASDGVFSLLMILTCSCTQNITAREVRTRPHARKRPRARARTGTNKHNARFQASCNTGLSVTVESCLLSPCSSPLVAQVLLNNVSFHSSSQLFRAIRAQHLQSDHRIFIPSTPTLTPFLPLHHCNCRFLPVSLPLLTML